MNEATREYARARQRLHDSSVAPVLEMLAAADRAVAAANQKAAQLRADIESLRPVWAQGFTSDGQAASANANALAEIWHILDVQNQTAAMAKLSDMLR